MGWFDEQIKQKVKQDEMAFSDALQGMAGCYGKRAYLEQYAGRTQRGG